MNETIAIGGQAPTNSASRIIAEGAPYIAHLTISGTAAFLFHRYQPEAVEAKNKAAKGSKAKKSDDVEAYVYRCDDNTLGIPGEYLRQAVIHAAKFKQDPRSPRKSAMDLYKAGVIALTETATLGAEAWDYEDRRRVVVQRNAVTRVRPAMRAGWRADFQFMVNTPEYISPDALLETLTTAGRLIGVGDFRPTYGRFQVVRFEVAEAG